jgi:hypothetical protein
VTLEARHAIAMAMFHAGRVDAGFELARESLAVCRKLVGPGDPLLAKALVGMAAAHGSRGSARDAEAPLREAVAIHRSHPDTAPLELAETVARLAEVCEKLRRLPEAAALAEEAIALARLSSGGEHAVTVSALLVLGMVRQAAGQAGEAVAAFREGLASALKIYGDANPWTARMREALALGLWDVGQHDEAFAEFERALVIRRRENGRGLCLCLNNVATLHMRRGDYRGAEAKYREAVEASTAIMGPHHHITAMAHANLGRCLGAVDDVQGATAAFATAASVYEAALGPDFATIDALTDLAQARLLAGDHDGALASQQHALELMAAAHPGDQPQTARLHEARGRLLAARGERREAMASLRESEAMYARLGQQHALARANVVQLIAEQLAAAGELREALASADAAVELVRSLPAAAEQELASALATAGDVRRLLRELPAAAAAYEAARDALIRLSADHPDLKGVLQPLAEVYAELGRDRDHAQAMQALDRFGQGR